MGTLEYIKQKYRLDDGPSPIEIRDTNRDDLGELFRELGFTRGAEIGVCCGDFSEQLCKDIPGLHLICIDPWIVYENYFDYMIQDTLNEAYGMAQEKLKNYDCELVRKFSMDAVKDIPDGSLDFVYIDGNHSLDNVINDLTQWSRKVRKDGIVSGHDYRSLPRRYRLHFQVVEAVNVFTRVNEINPWFLLGRTKSLPGEKRDKERTYLWVKKNESGPYLS
jgi:hypothetical protein